MPETHVELPAGSDVNAALRSLRERHPQLGPLIDPHSGLLLIALNREYVGPQRALSDGDELALFPPVSGGAGPGRALLLLSGGFDSPVAGHLAQGHGYDVSAVHFSMEPFTDDASTRKAMELCRILGIADLTVVPIGPELSEFRKHCDGGSYFVLQKRLMVRLAQELAKPAGARILVTGENLGQVSSQTLPNLGAIDAVATMPILRPLVGLDKVDIIDYARRISTFETSRGPEVCDVLGPRHPRTAVMLHKILEEEAKLDVAALVRSALARAHRPLLAQAGAA